MRLLEVRLADTDRQEVHQEGTHRLEEHQVGIQQASINQVDVDQVGMNHPDFDQVGIQQVGMHQVGMPRLRREGAQAEDLCHPPASKCSWRQNPRPELGKSQAPPPGRPPRGNTSARSPPHSPWSPGTGLSPGSAG